MNGLQIEAMQFATLAGCVRAFCITGRRF